MPTVGIVELSEKELICLIHLASGLRTAEVASEMSMARVTIDKYIKNVKTKLSAKTLPHAVAIAVTEGIIEKNLFARVSD